MQDIKKEMVQNYTEKYSKICNVNNLVDFSLYEKYGVKRGLRDINGKGVVTGITNISLQSQVKRSMAKVYHKGSCFTGATILI